MDSGVIWLIATFVDGRAFPMFGLLFGYGVAQIVRRQDAAGGGRCGACCGGAASCSSLGFLHSVLLYAGDILRAYGLLLFLGFWMVRWKDHWLLLSALVLLLLARHRATPRRLSNEAPEAMMLPADLGEFSSSGVEVSWFVTLVGPLGFPPVRCRGVGGTTSGPGTAGGTPHIVGARRRPRDPRGGARRAAGLTHAGRRDARRSRRWN